MKHLAAVLGFFSASAFAQNYQGMSEQQMQAMMQQMQQMESCMQNIDQAGLQALEQQSRRVEAEIKSLCEQGKRDDAQQRAISYGQELAADSVMQQMSRCGEIMKDAVPNMPDMTKFEEGSSRHVCD